MAFRTDILRGADGGCYTGHTDDLERCNAQHHHGGFFAFTSRHRPVALIWRQEFASRVKAVGSEPVVKRCSRARKDAPAAVDWARLSHFARASGERERVSTSLDTNGGSFGPEEPGSLPCDTNGAATADDPVTPRFVSSKVETHPPAKPAKPAAQRPAAP